MSQPTHIERLAGREAAGRLRARAAAAADDEGETPVVEATQVVDDSVGTWAIGTTVAGRFVLEQRLGRGRYGPIYKALDRSLSEALIGVEHHVALQELHPRVAADATLVERLEQLPFHPQSWSHPNIVKVLDFGRDGTRYFLCEEFLEGASLRLVLDKSAPEPLGYEEVLGVLRAVGDALNYAHAKGVVHGDLRPETVFVTSTYKVKVLGLLPSGEQRRAAFFLEDVAGDRQPHPSDDVYGLACLAYELLTARHPYNGNSPIEALRAGLLPHPVPGLPPLRWQALSRGLALRRERRTASIPELLVGLGVTGVETLHPEASTRSAPAQSAQPVQMEAWPEITATPATASRDDAAAAESWTDESQVFADPAFDYDALPERAARRTRPARKSGSAGVLVAAALVAAVAVFVYREHEQLRMAATDLIETAATFSSRQLDREQGAQPQPVGQPRGADGLVVARAPGDGADTETSAARPPDVSTPTGAATVPSVAATPPAAAAPSAVPPPAVPAPTASAVPAPAIATPPPQTAAIARPESPPEDEPPPQGTPRERPPERADRVSSAVAARPSAPTSARPASARFEFAERAITVRESEGLARIEIRRVGALDSEASVVWSTADRSASADEDYAVLGARAEHFSPGERSRVVYVPLIVDSRPERRESFIVNLRSDRAGAQAAAQLEVVILDDGS